MNHKTIVIMLGIVSLSGCMQNDQHEEEAGKENPQGYRVEKVLCHGAQESDPQSKYGGGDGTKEHPYLICTPEQFFEISAEGMTKPYFKVTADLDFAKYQNLHLFSIGGKLDGAGHTFRNIRSEPGNGFAEGGFIAQLNTLPGGEPDELRNLYIENLEVIGKSSATSNGGLLIVNWGGVIENVHVRGKVDVQADGVGGLVGSNYGIIRNSSFDGTVAGLNSVGGITGKNFGTIQTTSVSGIVAGASNVGGIVGRQPRTATLDQSPFHGNVTGQFNVSEQLGSWCEDSECRMKE